MVTFICGCGPKPSYRTQQLSTKVPGVFALSDTIYDSEGFIICPEHGEREVGWRTKTHTIQTPNGEKLDYAAIYRPKGNLKINTDGVDDRRDNRDPEKIGRAILSKRNGKNGKGEVVHD